MWENSEAFSNIPLPEGVLIMSFITNIDTVVFCLCVTTNVNKLSDDTLPSVRSAGRMARLLRSHRVWLTRHA